MIVLPGEIAAAIEEQGWIAPPEHEVAVWDGGSTAAIEGARFYVPSYMAEDWAFEVMRHMPLLEVCQLPTAGFEHARAHVPAGVVLCNAAGVHDASTAELAVALAIARLRNLDGMARAMPDGVFLHDRFDSLADKRVLVIGAGGVGGAIARRLPPFECTVTMVGRAARAGVQSVDDLPALLGQADVVFVAVPLDERTRHLVDRAFLARLHDGALVVNVSRGGVADTEAILGEAGRLRFALDVTDPEPLPPEHPLWRAPGVLISPHVGGNTSAFLPRIARLVSQQVRRWESGEPLANIVVS